MENHITFKLSLLETRMFLRRLYTAMLRIRQCAPATYLMVRPNVRRFAKDLSFKLKNSDAPITISVPRTIWNIITPHSSAGLTEESWRETLQSDAIEKIRKEIRLHFNLKRSDDVSVLDQNPVRELSETYEPEYNPRGKSLALATA